jgi:predicted DNA-binding protein (UPF0251 family)
VPRPRKTRFIQTATVVRYFKPRGIPLSDLTEMVLSLDGLEAVRLADVEGLEQADAALLMGISRSTFSRLLAEARNSVATALTNGWAIRIDGGPVEIACKRGRGCGRKRRCCRRLADENLVAGSDEPITATLGEKK